MCCLVALIFLCRGQFFTMQFNVTNIQESLITLYKECDPANLEKILIKSLPLLERHWNETVEFVKGTNNKELQVASTELNESEVAEVTFYAERVSGATSGWLKTPLSTRKVLSSIPWPVKSDTDAFGSLPLQLFCVALALSRGDEVRH